MRILVISFFLSVGLSNGYSQYCSSGGPTDLIDSNVELVNLVGESSNINFIGCPSVLGVQDLTNNIAYLNSGSNYSIDIQFSTCGNNYAGTGEAWIDFNMNGIFETIESIGTWTGTPPVSLSTFNFNVPGGTNSGLSRLRIIQQEAGTLPLNPCTSFSWGSVMDFSIYFQNGIDCSGVIGNSELNPIMATSIPFSDTNSTAICFSNNSSIYNSPDVFYQLIIDNSITKIIKASLCESNFDTYLTILDAQMNPLFFNDDSPTCGQQSEVVFETTNLDTIIFVVEGWGQESGDYILNISEEFLSIKTNQVQAPIIYPNPARTKWQPLY